MIALQSLQQIAPHVVKGLMERWKKRGRVMTPDPISFIRGERRFLVTDDARGYRKCTDTLTGKVYILTESAGFSLHKKICARLLWERGPAKAELWDASLKVIIIGLTTHPRLRPQRKRDMLVAWVVRSHERLLDDAELSRDEAIDQALKTYEHFSKHPNIGLMCNNRELRDAMRSRCYDEVSCRLDLNHGEVGEGLLRSLGVFSQSNARIPGIGATAGMVYGSLVEMAPEFEKRGFIYQDRVAFAAPERSLAERAGCTRKTARKALRALCFVGLIFRVPEEHIPQEFRRPNGLRQPGFYQVVPLSEELVRGILPRVRDTEGVRWARKGLSMG